MGILLICLAHAVPVWVVGIWFRSKGVTLVTAILSAVVGVLTGGPVFAILDLLAIVVAYQMASAFFRKPPVAPSLVQTPPPAQPVQTRPIQVARAVQPSPVGKFLSEFVWVVAAAAIIAAIVYKLSTTPVVA